MATAETVMTVYSDRGKRGLPLEGVYRQLYSRDLYLRAYGRIHRNEGAMTPGVTAETVDAMSLEKIDGIIGVLRREAYRWSPARRTHIPKKNGKKRPLGLPTWSDKLVQEAIRLLLDAYYEPRYSDHSHGFRQGRGCHTALREIAQRWRGVKWFIEGDIKGCFDSIETNLLMRAVRKHTDCPWVLLYIERWLKAPVQMPDGSLAVRERGTPQGGVVSPVLANLFLHYAFDVWMHRSHPGIPFERYADDAICHCDSEEQAEALRVSLEKRFAECGLTLHPEKTKIVYCKDDDRRGDYPNQKFDFLGYTFRPRLARRRAGKIGVSFSPAVSNKALKAIRQTVRRWSLHERSDKSLDDLARMFNAHIRGWINYYGRFYPSALYPTLRHIDVFLARWACRKFKTLYRHRTRAIHWLERIARRQTRLFAHWSLLYGRGRTMGAG